MMIRVLPVIVFVACTLKLATSDFTKETNKSAAPSGKNDSGKTRQLPKKNISRDFPLNLMRGINIYDDVELASEDTIGKNMIICWVETYRNEQGKNIALRGGTPGYYLSYKSVSVIIDTDPESYLTTLKQNSYYTKEEIVGDDKRIRITNFFQRGVLRYPFLSSKFARCATGFSFSKQIMKSPTSNRYERVQFRTLPFTYDSHRPLRGRSDNCDSFEAADLALDEGVNHTEATEVSNISSDPYEEISDKTESTISLIPSEITVSGQVTIIPQSYVTDAGSKESPQESRDNSASTEMHTTFHAVEELYTKIESNPQKDRKVNDKNMESRKRNKKEPVQDETKTTTDQENMANYREHVEGSDEEISESRISEENIDMPEVEETEKAIPIPPSSRKFEIGDTKEPMRSNGRSNRQKPSSASKRRVPYQHSIKQKQKKLNRELKVHVDQSYERDDSTLGAYPLDESINDESRSDESPRGDLQRKNQIFNDQEPVKKPKSRHRKTKFHTEHEDEAGELLVGQQPEDSQEELLNISQEEPPANNEMVTRPNSFSDDDNDPETSFKKRKSRKKSRNTNKKHRSQISADTKGKAQQDPLLLLLPTKYKSLRTFDDDSPEKDSQEDSHEYKQLKALKTGSHENDSNRDRPREHSWRRNSSNEEEILPNVIMSVILTIRDPENTKSKSLNELFRDVVENIIKGEIRKQSNSFSNEQSATRKQQRDKSHMEIDDEYGNERNKSKGIQDTLAALPPDNTVVIYENKIIKDSGYLPSYYPQNAVKTYPMRQPPLVYYRVQTNRPPYLYQPKIISYRADDSEKDYS